MILLPPNLPVVITFPPGTPVHFGNHALVQSVGDNVVISTFAAIPPLVMTDADAAVVKKIDAPCSARLVLPRPVALALLAHMRDLLEQPAGAPKTKV